jgi:hypothetical protein
MVNTKCDSQVLLFGDVFAAELACIAPRGVEGDLVSVCAENGEAWQPEITDQTVSAAHPGGIDTHIQ